MAEYVCFGEIMLRLKAPDHERLFQSPSAEATFGGGEANVAVALAGLRACATPTSSECHGATPRDVCNGK